MASFRIWSCTARMNCLEASHCAILEVQRSTCLPHIDGIKAWSQSTIHQTWCDYLDVTQKNRSHLGVEICFRRLHLGWGWNLISKNQRSLFLEKIPLTFGFIFPYFIAAKWRWNLQKTQNFVIFVPKVQWTAAYVDSLWTYFKPQVSNHNWQTNFTLPFWNFRSKYLESSSLHSGRLSMTVAGRLVAAVEEQLLRPVCRPNLRPSPGWYEWKKWTSWLPFEMTWLLDASLAILLEKFRHVLVVFGTPKTPHTQIKWQFPASAFEWPWIVKIGTWSSS